MSEKETRDNNQSFEEYRSKMHPEEEAPRAVVPAPKKPIAFAFGIFMIIVYVGVGILFLINFFNIDVAWVRYVIGILLIVYGVFRGYRMFTGMDYTNK